MKFVRGKDWSLSTRIGMFITAATLAGLFLLWLLISNLVVSLVTSNITNQMTDAVEARAEIINNYVSAAEEHLVAFSLGDEVRELLLDPTNPALVERAQQYTEDFAASKGVFEGLYIADTGTHSLTHLSREAIGRPTREGERLKQMQETILSVHRLTNIGIMQSPASGKMVISMYYPLFEGQTCIGYVGAAVYADQLMDSLLDLELEGLPGCQYIFLNADTGVYLYHENAKMLNTVTEDPNCLEIIKRVKAGDTVGVYSGDDGTFTVYRHLPEREWIFMVQDNRTEIFQDVDRMRVLTGVVCLLVASLILIVSLLRLRRVGRDLAVVKAAMEKLGRLELSPDQTLDRYISRGDEVGRIAATTRKLRGTLREAVGDVDRILDEIADGNLLVDVKKNRELYTGDFSSLAVSLETIQTKLTKLMRSINDVSARVTSGADQLASGSQNLAQGTTEQASAVQELVASMTTISDNISQSAARAGEANDQAADAAREVEKSKEQMDHMVSAMQEISGASAEIQKIIKTIEDIAFQTNILALNATVEAAHAGTAGKGFAVVAEEVRSLASKSAEASRSTTALIEHSVRAVDKGMALANETAVSLTQIVTMSEATASLISRISEAYTEQAEAVAQVSMGIDQISNVVQTNSATAEQSAAASQEQSGQARILKGLIAQFNL